MATASLDLSASNFRIRVCGKDLPDQANRDITEVAVEEDVDAPGMFSFTLNNWDLEGNTVKWSDYDQFAAGGEVTVSLGYGRQLESLLTGDITGLEPAFAASGSPAPSRCAATTGATVYCALAARGRSPTSPTAKLRIR